MYTAAWWGGALTLTGLHCSLTLNMRAAWQVSLWEVRTLNNSSIYNHANHATTDTLFFAVPRSVL